MTHVHLSVYSSKTRQVLFTERLSNSFFFQIRKALELYEQLRQRMGVVIVGPSGSGKSVVWRLLRTALNRRGQTVKDYTMNPKAMPRTQVGSATLTGVVYAGFLFEGDVVLFHK